MKKITLSILSILTIGLVNAQNDCANAGTATPGVTSVGAIDGALDTTCFGLDAATSGEWYAYTATLDGVATVTSDLPQNDGVTNSDDTRLSVLSGACGSLTCLTSGDDVSASNFLTTVAFAITTGTTYYLQWDDRWSTAQFDFEITETSVSCPDGSLPFSDDFSDPNTLLACWTVLDEDGDGQAWYTADYDLDNDGNPDGDPTLASNSWNGTPLTPDNWLISPAIDLTPYSAGDTVELSWSARGIDLSYALENYSVYAADGDTTGDFLAAADTFTETLGPNDPNMDDVADFETRTLDISSLVGQMAYVAFRHHAVSDQFVLNIDNIAIDVTLGTSDLQANEFSHFFNRENDVLTIKSSTLNLTNVEIFNILGRSVYSSVLDSDIERINLSALNDGVYLAKVEVNGAAKTIKFIKN